MRGNKEARDIRQPFLASEVKSEWFFVSKMFVCIENVLTTGLFSGGRERQREGIKG